MQRQDLLVADALVSGGGEPFPCGFEEVELVVQLADENPLSTVDLRAQQKLSTRVRVNAQEVSYLVRSAQWGSHKVMDNLKASERTTNTVVRWILICVQT